MPEFSAGLTDNNREMDVGIKLVLAILLAAVSSFCRKWMDLGCFSVFLLAVTILLKSDLRFVIKNLLSFGIIIVFPYSFGLLFSLVLGRLFPGFAYMGAVNWNPVFIKIIKIFFIWYIGNLYFFTTSFEAITDMLNKVFAPLNAKGIPVAKYLNMVVFIINELAGSVSQFKKDIFEQAKHVIKNDNLSAKTKIKELSHILASFIASSLQRAGEIQERMELDASGNCRYSLRIARNEIAAILIIVIFVAWFLHGCFI